MSELSIDSVIPETQDKDGDCLTTNDHDSTQNNSGINESQDFKLIAEDETQAMDAEGTLEMEHAILDKTRDSEYSDKDKGKAAIEPESPTKDDKDGKDGDADDKVEDNNDDKIGDNGDDNIGDNDDDKLEDAIVQCTPTEEISHRKRILAVTGQKRKAEKKPDVDDSQEHSDEDPQDAAPELPSPKPLEPIHAPSPENETPPKKPMEVDEPIKPTEPSETPPNPPDSLPATETSQMETGSSMLSKKRKISDRNLTSRSKRPRTTVRSIANEFAKKNRIIAELRSKIQILKLRLSHAEYSKTNALRRNAELQSAVSNARQKSREARSRYRQLTKEIPNIKIQRENVKLRQDLEDFAFQVQLKIESMRTGVKNATGLASTYIDNFMHVHRQRLPNNPSSSRGADEEAEISVSRNVGKVEEQLKTVTEESSESVSEQSSTTNFPGWCAPTSADNPLLQVRVPPRNRVIIAGSEEITLN